MFTGLVEQMGFVVELSSHTLKVRPRKEPDSQWEVGESVAVNGCCLTVVAVEDGFCFDLSEETLQRTNLSDLKAGSAVNIERALRMGDRLGGHFVQGHVDTRGQVVSISTNEGSSTFVFEVESRFDRYLIDKGSVAVDGVSLTVVRPHEGRFEAWIIPQTLASTNLGTMTVGQKVNIEFDLLAKHLEKLIASRLL